MFDVCRNGERIVCGGAGNIIEMRGEQQGERERKSQFTDARGARRRREARVQKGYSGENTKGQT